MVNERNSKLILNIILGVIVLIIAVLFWPNENKIVRDNEIDKTKTQIKIKQKRINIRQEASVDSLDIGDVYEGEVYTVLSHIDKDDYYWYHIKTNDLIDGYIASAKDQEYVEVISGYIDRTPPVINVENEFLLIVDNKENFDSVSCVDDYSKCSLSYDETDPLYIKIKAVDEDLNEAFLDVRYYKVYSLFKEYYQNNSKVNARYEKEKTNDKYTIKATYTLNQTIQSENKSYSYTPIINFYDKNFEEIKDVYVSYNNTSGENCINDENLKLKKEYENNSLIKGNSLCISYSFSNKNDIIKYVSFGFESVDNYTNKDNLLASNYSNYFILNN